MISSRRPLAIATVVLSTLGSIAVGEEVAAKGGNDAKPSAPASPRKIVREHHVRAGGTDLSYTSTAEEVRLEDADGKPTASFFTISYAESGAVRSEDRPITFVYNGGPGSASLWLHLGLVGPRTIDIPSDAGDPGLPPYRLKDNPWTILRATDLVFVDPVGTGYSKPLGEKKGTDFWGFEEDADSVAEFIRTFLTLKDRWNSPKFLLGESYGGIRSALLVPRLQQEMGIRLNGIILLSPGLNMGLLPFYVAGNDLPYATELPAFAAVAYYHHKLPDSWPSLEALLAEVEAYAGGDYLKVLFAGDRLSELERDEVAARLHRFTGLSTTYLLHSGLRINADRFCKELLRDEGKSIGILDGRYAQDELDDVAAYADGDPSQSKIDPVYFALLQSYFHDELGVDRLEPFVGTNLEAHRAWKRPARNNRAFAGYVDVTGDLAQGTKDNEALRIFAGAGVYDLSTSYFATGYMLRHSGIDPAQLTIKDYPGGHMMYLHQPSLEKLSNDIVAFIAGGH